MTDIKLKQIKKEALKLIELFKVSDKKLAIIKANDMCNLYCREEIEQMKYEIKELYKFTEKNVLINL